MAIELYVDSQVQESLYMKSLMARSREAVGVALLQAGKSASWSDLMSVADSLDKNEIQVGYLVRRENRGILDVVQGLNPELKTIALSFGLLPSSEMIRYANIDWHQFLPRSK